MRKCKLHICDKYYYDPGNSGTICENKKSWLVNRKSTDGGWCEKTQVQYLCELCEKGVFPSACLMWHHQKHIVVQQVSPMWETFYIHGSAVWPSPEPHRNFSVNITFEIHPIIAEDFQYFGNSPVIAKNVSKPLIVSGIWKSILRYIPKHSTPSATYVRNVFHGWVCWITIAINIEVVILVKWEMFFQGSARWPSVETYRRK